MSIPYMKMKEEIEKKNLIIYHRVDFDGIFSGIIIRYFLGNEGKIEMLGWNYNDPIPDLLGYDGTIWLVDLSLPENVMLDLKNHNKELVWIDHHETAINASINLGYSDITGLRRNGTAAAELCWEYMSGGNRDVPQIIQYISAYDVWDHVRFDWDSEVLPIQSALRLYYGVKIDPIYKDFDNLLNNPATMEELLKAGRIISAYNSKRWETAVKSFSFPITVGTSGLKALCMLTSEFSSMPFASKADEYDLFCSVNTRNGGDSYSVSLYSSDKSDIGEFSCGQFMKENYSGGGHKGAAGGFMTEEQFFNLLHNKHL